MNTPKNNRNEFANSLLETEKLWGHDLFHLFLNKWLEESLL